MKINPIIVIIGVFIAILGLAVIGLIVYLTLGFKEGSTANPGGLIAGATLLWASLKTKILNLNGQKLVAFAGMSGGVTAPVQANKPQTSEQQEQERLEQQRIREEQEHEAAAIAEREHQRAAKMEQARLRVRNGISLDQFDLIDRDTVERAMQTKGYELYEAPGTEGEQAFQSNGINIVGIRNNNAKPNSFDDALVVFWKPAGSQDWEFRRYKGTTDPGLSYLGKNKMGNEDGTAILKEGQYRAVYQIGKHHGKYKALTQAGPMTVIRDHDRDSILDFGSGNFFEGIFGINIHRSNPDTESIEVNKWSAGCQVFAKAAEWKEFIALCDKAAKKHGQRFSYTLLNVEDIIQAVA